MTHAKTTEEILAKRVINDSIAACNSQNANEARHHAMRAQTAFDQLCEPPLEEKAERLGPGWANELLGHLEEAWDTTCALAAAEKKAIADGTTTAQRKGLTDVEAETALKQSRWEEELAAEERRTDYAKARAQAEQEMAEQQEKDMQDHLSGAVPEHECGICEVMKPDESELSSPAGDPSHAPEPDTPPHGSQSTLIARQIATVGRKHLTERSKELFLEYARDAGNWNGMPLVGGNVGTTKADQGNLTHLKQAGLVKTEDDGDRRDLKWLVFTDLGRAYAKANGVDLDWTVRS